MEFEYINATIFSTHICLSNTLCGTFIPRRIRLSLILNSNAFGVLKQERNDDDYKSSVLRT